MCGGVKFTIHVEGRGTAEICGVLLIRSCFISLYCSYCTIGEKRKRENITEICPFGASVYLMLARSNRREILRVMWVADKRKLIWQQRRRFSRASYFS